MSTPTIVNLAPTALCLVLAAYAAWPYVGLSEPPREKAPAGSAAEVGESLLSPAVGGPHERDPYLDPEESRAEAATKLAGILNGWMRSNFPSKEDIARATAAAKPKPEVQTVTASSGRGIVVGGEPSEDLAPEDDPRGEMVLKLTSVRGQNRLAMIGDRIYETGDAVRGLSASRGPCFVAEIRHHEVILNYRGRRIPLRYRELRGTVPVARAASPTPPTARRPAAAPAPKVVTPAARVPGPRGRGR